ncbi:MAG: pyridoxine 5'-phosphate synthase [Desulfobulbaceae bacterium]|nr:pyridoxine 5'-phosphate synthase [Desulfobulbaceae bacterium]
MRSEASGHHPIQLHRLRHSAEVLLRQIKHDNSELSLLLVSDPAMQELNRHYRQKNKPTNVLSFPMHEGRDIPDGTLLGDIVISADTVAREAKALKVPFRKRLNWLLIHGLVHLLGYDHERSSQEALLMEAREQELQQHLNESERRISMTQLAINVDHVATLRQARGISEPDPVLAAGICELAGASGIVVHLREDRRHIQDRDVRILRETVKTRLNLEMGATPEIIDIALRLKPDMVTLVPEKRQELTTEGGLNVSGQKKKLTEVIKQMTAAGIPVSLFIDPEPKQISAAAAIGATFVEIHTGRYCDAENDAAREHEFELVAEAADFAYGLDLKVNAGHGLNYLNARRIAALDAISELSIGHSVMARAIMVGLDQAVREMLALVAG